MKKRDLFVLIAAVSLLLLSSELGAQDNATINDINNSNAEAMSLRAKGLYAQSLDKFQATQQKVVKVYGEESAAVINGTIGHNSHIEPLSMSG